MAREFLTLSNVIQTRYCLAAAPTPQLLQFENVEHWQEPQEPRPPPQAPLLPATPVCNIYNFTHDKPPQPTKSRKRKRTTELREGANKTPRVESPPEEPLPPMTPTQQIEGVTDLTPRRRSSRKRTVSVRVARVQKESLYPERLESFGQTKDNLAQPDEPLERDPIVAVVATPEKQRPIAKPRKQKNPPQNKSKAKSSTRKKAVPPPPPLDENDVIIQGLREFNQTLNSFYLPTIDMLTPNYPSIFRNPSGPLFAANGTNPVDKENHTTETQ